jgi:hypothetical protein
VAQFVICAWAVVQASSPAARNARKNFMEKPPLVSGEL